VVDEVDEVVLVLSVDPDVVVDESEVVLEATVVEAAALALEESEVVVVSEVVLAVSAVVVDDFEVVSLVVESVVESALLFNSFSGYSSSSTFGRDLHVSAHI